MTGNRIYSLSTIINTAMTPAINTAKKANINYQVHEYDHDPAQASYGQEAANKLGISEDRVYKTLVVSTAPKQLAVAVIPVSCMLNMKQVARALGSKKAGMANAHDVERTTGYVLGGVSPLGQKKTLTTVIDASCTNFETIFVSAGRRGLEIELSPGDLLSLTRGTLAELTQ